MFGAGALVCEGDGWMCLVCLNFDDGGDVSVGYIPVCFLELPIVPVSVGLDTSHEQRMLVFMVIVRL